jgi:DNA polymerase-4
LKIRGGDFTTITRSTTRDVPTDQTQEIWEMGARLFEKWAREHPEPVRLIGIGVSGLSGYQGQQLLLFDQPQIERRRQLDHAVDEIRNKFGYKAISRGQIRRE